MPPVSGLLAPTDSRPPFGAVVPPSVPGANTSFAAGPSGSAVGGYLVVDDRVGQRAAAVLGPALRYRLDGDRQVGHVDAQ